MALFGQPNVILFIVYSPGNACIILFNWHLYTCMNNGTSRYYDTLIRSGLLLILICFTFIILRCYDLTMNSLALLTCPYVVWYYCSVYCSDSYFITKYTIVVGSAALIAPNLPNCIREAILSLITSINNLCTASKSSLDIVLLVNWMVSSYWRRLAQASIQSWKRLVIMLFGRFNNIVPCIVQHGWAW